MTIRNAGVRLSYEQFADFMNKNQQLQAANKHVAESLQKVAAAQQQTTNATRGSIQQRINAASAEAKAVDDATAKIIGAGKRQTAAVRSEAQAQAAARQQAARAAQQQATPAAGGGGFGSSFLGGAVKTGLGVGLGLLGVAGIQQTLSTAVELDTLRGQVIGTDIALKSLAGGGVQASAAIRQIQSVAPGATSALDAAQGATTILTQKLNSSAVSLGEIARATSIIPQVSSSIKSQGDALGQLTLFSNSASFARADQLASTAEDVQQRVKELAQTFPELSDAQLKAAATVQLINERFDALGDAAAANVTGVQSLSSAFADLKQTIATGSVGQGVDEFFKRIADGIREVNLASGGGTVQDQFILLDRQIQGQSAPLSPEARRFGATQKPQSEINDFQEFRDQAEETLLVLERGGSAAEPFVAQLREQIEAVHDAHGATQANIDALKQLEVGYRSTTVAAEDFTQTVSESTQQFLDEQAKLRELAEARKEVDALAKSSLDLFAQGAPGADELSQSLIELQGNLAGHTTLTEEDAAAVAAAKQEHQLLAAAAGGSVGALDAAAQAKLNDAVAAHEDTLANLRLKAAYDAVRSAQAGVSRGIVSSLSGLVGGGTINQSQALAINRSQQQQAAAGFAGIQAQGLTGPALSFATAGLQRELEAPFREWDQISKNITMEAHAQHQASQGASKEWNKAQKDAEKAAKATQKALEGVEGLFGASKVTQGQLDIAAGGGAVNVPDDFLRRFRDVSENFKEKGFRDDFGQEQLNEARAALERIGVQPLEDLKGLFAQFEEAWINSSLFSSKENLALINKQAVEDNLALQTKMEEGRKNIFEMFGIAIDDSVEAIGAGGSIPFDQEGLNKRLAEAEATFWEGVATRAQGAMSFGSSGVSLSDQVRGGKAGGLEGLQQSFNNATSTSDILRGTFEGVTTTADILREAFGRSSEAADILATHIYDIPQVVWENHIDEFPAWKGDEGIIPVFPGWENWLGAGKVDTGTADMGATGTTGAVTVSPVQQAMTQPAANTTNTNTRTTTVTIHSNQSTGSLLGDWAIAEARAR